MTTPVRTLRIDDELWDAIGFAADHHGQTRSDWMLGALRRAAAYSIDNRLDKLLCHHPLHLRRREGIDEFCACGGVV